MWGDNRGRVIAISEYIKELQKKIDELEWDGGDAPALRKELAKAIQSRAEGADFHVRF